MIVVDASITAAFVLPDEPSPPAHIAEQLLSGGILVPQHWHFEVANALNVAERRKRIDRETRDWAFARLVDWVVDVDTDGFRSAWTDVPKLSDQHGLTIYDAAYLELALRRSAALASIDDELVEAAIACGVDVLTYKS